MKRNDTERIMPERLMECVDAVFHAWESHDANGIELRHPLEILGAPDMPECLAEFTRSEVGEASKFLERIGVIVRVRRG